MAPVRVACKLSVGSLVLLTNRDPHITATFLHITHPHGHLHISANHLILSGEQRRPVPAGHLTVGDTIHSFLATATAISISVPVLDIHTCTQVGFYAPFTNNGLIVVDGIASSVYSQLSPPRSRSHVHVCAGVSVSCLWGVSSSDGRYHAHTQVLS